jgi:curli production assembly/transport component CsgF
MVGAERGGMRFSGLWSTPLFFFSLVVAANSQDFAYKPVNPSFGGSSFNSAHLLSMAERQNQFPNSSDRSDPFSRTSTQQFERQIQSALLGRISSQIVDQILGESAADSGRFSVGSTQIEFERIEGVVAITINDAISGGSTVIEIPVPDF